MIKKIIILFTVLFFIFQNQINAEVIKEIELKGNNRVSLETIKVYGNFDINDDIDDIKLNNITKDLYSTNFFEKINLDLNNNKLIITIVENPIIQTTFINGIKKKDIEDELRKLIISRDKSPLVKSIVLDDVKKIKSILKNVGYYFIDIKSNIEKNDNNTVNLYFDINLGERATIGKINFIGDKKIKNRKLRSIITSEESKFWKFISKKKFLDEKRIGLDTRLLKNYYLNHGYYDVDVEHTSASYLDNDNFELTFKINSGNKYTFNNLELILPPEYEKKNFKKIFDIFKDIKEEEYSLVNIEKIIDEVDKIALAKQYEFINASFNEEKLANKINLSIVVTESEKFYVKRVNILGNTITEDKIIRNALIVDEGDPFNKILFNKSINNLKSKNIFKSVESKVINGNEPNTKILEITVDEKPTGEISAGAGVGTSGGTLAFSIGENNFLGKEINVSTNIQLAADSIKGAVGFKIPNYKYSEKSLEANLESINIDKKKDAGYESSKTGFSVGTSFEQLEDFYVSASLQSFSESVTTSSTASSALKKQDGNYFENAIAYSLTMDKRNQKFQPSDGYRSSFYQKLPLWTDSNSIVNSYTFTTFHKLTEQTIGKFSIYTKAITALTDGKDVRISERIMAPRSRLRGFEPGKVGPVDGKDFIGGNYLTTMNVSATLPKLFPEIESADFKVFIDAANLWGVDYSSTVDSSNKIRSSAGLAIDWFTPVGPLNFSFSQNITKASTDITESFRFNLGTTF